MGFYPIEGDSQNPEGVSYFENYDGDGEDRVIFIRRLKEIG
ncbi:hypothetical protein [Xanthovirga aplysinae]|nr:hypothetical protein [Xanthovirga aplysinae]